MPGPTGGGRSGGGGGIGGGARGGGFSGGSHGGFSSGSNRTFRSGVPRGTGSFYTDSPDNPNGEEDTKKRFRNMIIMVVLIAVFTGGPVISMVGNLFSDLASPSPDIWAEIDSVIIGDDDRDSEYYITPVEGERTKLDESLCTPIDTWFEDHACFLANDDAVDDLDAALKYFYELTGVQPYLIILDNIDGICDPDWETIDNYLYNRYIELFGEDEGHYLFLYFMNTDGTYTTWYCPGLYTMRIMDDNAYYILTDYLNMYYYEAMTRTEMFELTFISTAEDIMRVNEGASVTVPVVELTNEVESVEPESVVESTGATVEVTYHEEITYYEEPDSDFVWDEDVTDQAVEHYITADTLKYIAGGFVILLAVILFVVYILWDKKKMRDLEDDI